MLKYTPNEEKVEAMDFSKLETVEDYKSRLFKMKQDIQDMIDMTNLKIQSLIEDPSNWDLNTIYYNDLSSDVHDIGWYHYTFDMQKEAVSPEDTKHRLQLTANDGGYILARLLKKDGTHVEEVFRSPVACILTPIQDIVRDAMLSIWIDLDAVDEKRRDGCSIFLKDRCHHVSTIYLGIAESRKKLANYQVALHCINLTEEAKRQISEFRAVTTMLDRYLGRLEILYDDITRW